ncbi:MAG: PAS domain S-box protein [Gammaproteobacteria bacterium]|nr:PAS domain S-box protein [Gammaproteobacteria bacterium]MBU1645347.1 PAS domain S-box protein [Gammaproteobacteria bacterium]
MIPRFVKHIYFGRTAAFAYAFVVLAVLAHERNLGLWLLLPLALQFLVLPQLFWWQVWRAQDPRRVALGQLHLDALLLGCWFAEFGFAGWAGLGLLLSTSLNGIVLRGLPGLAAALSLFAVGAAGWGLCCGFRYQPEVSPLVMHLSVAGSLIYAWFVGYVVFYNSGRLSRARREIRQSEERYRLIAENAGDLVAAVNGYGQWLYTSPSFRDFLAESDLAIGGDSYANIFAEDRPALAAAVSGAAATGTSFDLRLRLRGMDGNLRLLALSGHPAQPDGRPDRVVLVAHDITELRQQQDRLEVAAHAFDQMSEAIMIHDLAGEIIMVNHGFCRITGHALENVIGRHESTFRNACQPAIFYEQIYATVEREGRWTGSTWARRKDGSLYREWRNVSAVKDEAGRIKHIVTIFFELDSHNAALAAPVAHLALRRR